MSHNKPTRKARKGKKPSSDFGAGRDSRAKEIVRLTRERDDARAESARWERLHAEKCGELAVAVLQRDEARADCDKMSHLHATLTDELARVKAELAKWVPVTQTVKPGPTLSVEVVE